MHMKGSCIEVSIHAFASQNIHHKTSIQLNLLIRLKLNTLLVQFSRHDLKMGHLSVRPVMI